VIPFKQVWDDEAGEWVFEVSMRGQMLLDHALLNKGSAFTDEERREFGLLGLLPPHVSTVEEQVKRNYANFLHQETDLERYIFLVALQDRNETLFHRLLKEYIQEMMPIIYTPGVGVASQHYSHIYRRPRGLYVSYPHRASITRILANAPNPDVSVIVVTDGERVLGLGDLGIGGMGIPVGKLSLYTTCAGIHPATTLPIILDVGTDNPDLLRDPLYLGWRHERVRGEDYDGFIETFVRATLERFPNVLLQWEDFARHNARRLLERYRDQLCTFNDDIQGTASVVVAGLYGALKMTGAPFAAQRVVLAGAGASAHGIADLLVLAFEDAGLTRDNARRRIAMVDSHGLVTRNRPHLEDFKATFARSAEDLAGCTCHDPSNITLEETIRHFRPTILIGTSGTPRLFSKAVVWAMAAVNDRPVVMPLSNPTSKSECTAEEAIHWSDGRAIVATGSPFDPVEHNGRRFHIGQGNNAFVFPGVITTGTGFQTSVSAGLGDDDTGV